MTFMSFYTLPFFGHTLYQLKLDESVPLSSMPHLVYAANVEVEMTIADTEKFSKILQYILRCNWTNGRTDNKMNLNWYRSQSKSLT